MRTCPKKIVSTSRPTVAAELYIVRHGEPTPVGLTEDGQEQALVAARQLEVMLGETQVRLVATRTARSRATADIIGRLISSTECETVAEHARLESVEAVVRLCAGSVVPVVMVGHQPQIEELYYLADRQPPTTRYGTVHHFKVISGLLEAIIE